MGLMKSKNGFTYVDLMIGVSILFMSFTFFINMYRMSAQNRLLTSELMAMQKTASNLAEVYKNSRGSLDEIRQIMLNEAANEGFKDGCADVQINEDETSQNIIHIIIKIKPRYSIDGLNEYILKFDAVNPSLF